MMIAGQTEKYSVNNSSNVGQRRITRRSIVSVCVLPRRRRTGPARARAALHAWTGGCETGHASL